MLAAGCDPESVSDWIPLGDAVEDGAQEQEFRPSIVVDPATGYPLVALHQLGPEGHTARVMAWDGSAWNPIGDRVNALGYGVSATSLALDGDGRPWLAWCEQDEATLGGTHIRVSSWDGSAWIPRGAELELRPGAGTLPSIAIDGTGTPIVAWEEADLDDNSRPDIQVKQWDGAAWVTPPDWFEGLEVARDQRPTVVIGGDGNPVVAWDSAPDGGGGGVIVTRWTGTTWSQLGEALDEGETSLGRFVALAADGDALYLTLNGGGLVNGIAGDDLHVKRWDGSAWTDVGGILDTSPDFLARTSSIAVDGAGRPVVTWSQQASGSNDVHVKRWDGAEWEALEGALNETNGYNPVVAIGADDQPIVVWDQSAYIEEPPHVRARQWRGD